MATLVVAFCITSFLTDALVRRERLAVVGEMASVVGHDLRNPLGAVSNALFLLQHGLGDDVTVDQERHFQMAGREIAKAAAIIDHLSSYVRPGEPIIAPMELGERVAEVPRVTPPLSGHRRDVGHRPDHAPGGQRPAGPGPDQPDLRTPTTPWVSAVHCGSPPSSRTRPP